MKLAARQGLGHGHAAAQQKSKFSWLRARDLSPRNKATWSRPFAPERAGACKNLQDVPKQASTIDLGRPRRGRADPDFPGSAAICGGWHRPVTPEAAGSSPVDPANYLIATKGFLVRGARRLQTGRSPRDGLVCKRGGIGRHSTPISPCFGATD